MILFVATGSRTIGSWHLTNCHESTVNKLICEIHVILYFPHSKDKCNKLLQEILVAFILLDQQNLMFHHPIFFFLSFTVPQRKL